MIQRVQTLFLIIAAGLLASLLLTPMAYIGEEVTVKYTEYYIMLTFVIATLALSAITIFLYKNRALQMRLCVLNSLLLVAFQTWIVVLFFKNRPEMIFSITAVFPIIATILTILALRYIARDEAMVAAASRLRGKRKK